MTKIDFYFDPSCPFCWVTSRWLLQVSGARDIDVTWRPFSLTLKNNEMSDRGKDKTPHGNAHRAGHRIHRVIAVAAAKGASVIDLYSAFGIQYHIAGMEYSDEGIRDVLAQLKLPAELQAAADDTSLDTGLAAELQTALDVAGKDIGVPTIVFYSDDGSKLGYFGPVLQELPELSESLRIWDGLEKLATVKSFYELKRTRPDGGPNTASTAKC